MLLLFCSCTQKQKMYDSLSIGKLELPYEECRYDTNNRVNSCTEAYLVNDFDINDSLKIDTINKFIIEHYSTTKVKEYNNYSILVYGYDFYGIDGVNERMDYNKEVRNCNYRLLVYTWVDGNFKGLYVEGTDKVYDSIKGL